MADNINSTNPSDIATRAQVEREIIDWLHDQVVVPPQLRRSFIWGRLWAIIHPFQFGKQFGRIKFAAEAITVIQRGDYRKDKA